MSFRNAAFLGAIAGVALGLFLLRLWQPELQVQKHADHLREAITHKDWAKFGTFIADNYHDQWGNDRALLLARTREVFSYLRDVRIDAIGSNVRLAERSGVWRANIIIDGEGDTELMMELKTRVNKIETPFELEWHRMSSKPWDWKLVSVRNPELAIPSEY
jgi:hypothetical protein